MFSRGVQPAKAGFVDVAGGFSRPADPERANTPARRAEALGYHYKGHAGGLPRNFTSHPCRDTFWGHFLCGDERGKHR